jgi:hypothetical protein
MNEITNHNSGSNQSRSKRARTHTKNTHKCYRKERNQEKAATYLQHEIFIKICGYQEHIFGDWSKKQNGYKTSTEQRGKGKKEKKKKNKTD